MSIISLQQPAEPGPNDIIPLDMAPNSVDDLYGMDCRDKMPNLIKQYLLNERNTNSRFKDAWDQSEQYYDNNRKNFMRMQKEEFVAVSVYTTAKGNIHDDFNAAVRSQGPQYKTTFGYHALHFYLTVALQTLKAIQSEKTKCITSYRRVDRYFSQDVENKEIRFGSFTSSSLGRYINAARFGNKSCFKIDTCFGAEITNFSKFRESEGEVLIPPYEVFKVKKIEKSPDNEPCEVVYRLKSTGALSNFDCALFSE